MLSLKILPTSPVGNEKIIRNLKNSSPGIDLIKSSILKEIPLSHIVNLSLKEGIFPNSLKKGIISRIYKSKSRTTMNSYRPVSVLPAI